MFGPFVSLGTVVAIVAGLIISYFYLYYMGAALRKSVRTRFDRDEGQPDKYHHSLVGAVIAVIVSIISIAIYGFGP
jgi:H+/gluconate symporter-like permease